MRQYYTLYKKPKSRPFYSPEEIREFHEVRNRINAKRRMKWGKSSEVSANVLDEFIKYSGHSDPSISAYGERGIKASLSDTFKVSAVLAILLLAREAFKRVKEVIFSTMLEASIIRNVGLITTIPESVKLGLARKIFQIASGKFLSQNRVKKLLIDDYGLDESKADIIALDQSRKYDNAVREAVQVSEGIEKFMWQTMRDEKVRLSHREREGKIYLWNSDDIKPGDEHGCRCISVPIIRRRSSV